MPEHDEFGVWADEPCEPADVRHANLVATLLGVALLIAGAGIVVAINS